MSAKSKNLILILLISSFLFSPVIPLTEVKQARAQSEAASVPTFDAKANIELAKITASVGVTAKKSIWQKIKIIFWESLKAAARQVLVTITRNIINWINSGFYGNPLFVENPRSFFGDMDKFEIRALVDMYGYDLARFPYGRDWALNTIYSYRGGNNAGYTLSNYGLSESTLKGYQNDFNVGGLNGFLINTQYPQNNYLGFMMSVNKDLSGNIGGEEGSIKGRIQTTLSQGMGFLSPQTCPSNSQYNDGLNEWHQPNWTSSQEFTEANKKYTENMPYCADDYNCTEEELARIKQYREDYTLGLAAAQQKWGEKNTCPGGLVNTTPGSVVANQVQTAITSQFRTTELAAAVGNSVGAIVGALVDKFVQDGLNALMDKARGDPPKDTWSYDGLTLGSDPAYVTGYGDNVWDTPDVIVSLASFKEDVNESIEKARSEIKYLTNSVPDEFGPGVMQLIAQTWPEIKDLDVCVPGPDLSWQSRFDTETVANQAKFGGDAANREELAYAAGALKSWMGTQIKYNLPTGASFMETIEDLPDLRASAVETENAIDQKEDALAELEQIKTALDGFAGDPEPDSEEEDKMFQLWTQYQNLSAEIGNDTTLSESRSMRERTSAELTRIKGLITKCQSERGSKGWNPQGGAASLHSSGATELTYFCGAPIAGGFSHKNFVNPLEPTYPQIPLVNAQNVGTVNVALNCSTIFNANVSDYQGNLPSF